MDIDLIKPIVRVGNSAGVILPREWLHGEAKVTLIRKGLEPEKEIFEILKDNLHDVLGIYMAGSYARGEQNEKSDVDILVITNKTNLKINKGKYEILIISKDNLEREIELNALPLIPMLKEAKTILNSNLSEKYKNTQLTEKNLRFHFETSESALKINEDLINIARETGSNCGDEVAYSLVLRLRETYIIDCIIKGKLWSNKEFLNLIKRVSGSLTAYNGYLRVKGNMSSKEELDCDEAERLLNHIASKIKESKAWIRKR